MKGATGMPFLNRERERGHPQTKGVVDSRLRVPLVRVASARRRRSRARAGPSRRRRAARPRATGAGLRRRAARRALSAGRAPHPPRPRAPPRPGEVAVTDRQTAHDVFEVVQTDNTPVVKQQQRDTDMERDVVVAVDTPPRRPGGGRTSRRAIDAVRRSAARPAPPAATPAVPRNASSVTKAATEAPMSSSRKPSQQLA